MSGFGSVTATVSGSFRRHLTAISKAVIDLHTEHVRVLSLLIRGSWIRSVISFSWRVTEFDLLG
jgi:hypothetical protein